MFKLNKKQPNEKSDPNIPTVAAMSEFSRFFNSDAGDRLLRHQRAKLSTIMPSVVGYNCLQFSVAKGISLCETDSIGHYVKMGYAPGYDIEEDDDCWVDMSALPVASDCVDIAILHHMLDFSCSPHQALREVDRTLTEGGHLILISFQPRSIWSAVKRYWAAKHWIDSRIVMRCNPVSSARMNDWLRLLNYDVLHQQANYFVSKRIDGLLSSETDHGFVKNIAQKALAPLGVYSIIVARKRRNLVNPLVSSWKVPSMRRKHLTAKTRATSHSAQRDKTTDKPQIDC